MSAEEIDQARKADSASVFVQRTHFIEWDQPKLLGRQQRAACGRLVHSESFSTDPSCLECQQIMREDNELLATL